MTKTNTIQGGNHAWAPLSFPSASIFSSYDSASPGGSIRRRGDVGGSNPIEQRVSVGNVERRPNPYFPLHRDVLLATMRELLIMSGKIDHRTLEMTSKADSSPSFCKSPPIVHSKIDGKIQKLESCKSVANKMKRTLSAVSNSSDDCDAIGTSPTVCKKQRSGNRVNVSVASQFTKETPQPHMVPSIDESEVKLKDFDYKLFRSSEDLVEYAVRQAIPTFSTSVASVDNAANPEDEKEPATKSARKVSDVDILETKSEHGPSLLQNDQKNFSFPQYIVSLVRSNIMLFQTPHAKAKPIAPKTLSNCTPNSTLTDREKNIFNSELKSPMIVAELLPNNTTNFFKTNDAILTFLQYPQQHHREKSTHRFALPKLLDASITDEHNLRKAAHEMTKSMLNAFPDDDLDAPMRMFLGYKHKTTKAPSRDQMVEIISDILFDASHALYAWVQTENEVMLEMKRKKNNNPSHVLVPKRSQAINTPTQMIESNIKNLLFDDLAIKRIGGFEPSSLLPLALGIRRCRRAKTSWSEFAYLAEGQEALSIHKAANSHALIELGKLRKGRRGRQLRTNSVRDEILVNSRVKTG